jgi:serine phosphatase RsbU (regulator of sigma subunit)
MFGEHRLLEIIRQEAPAGSRAVERRLLKAIEAFTQGMPQTDDITFVVVEKSGSTARFDPQISIQ